MGERLNIKNLVIEPEGRPEEIPFQTEKYLTEADWQGMNKEYGRQQDHFEAYGELVGIKCGMRLLCRCWAVALM